MFAGWDELSTLHEQPEVLGGRWPSIKSMTLAHLRTVGLVQQTVGR